MAITIGKPSKASNHHLMDYYLDEQKKEKEWAVLLGTLKCPCCGYNATASMSTKMKKKYNISSYLILLKMVKVFA